MENKQLEEAKKAGEIDEVNARLTVAYMLFSQGYALFDDSENLLKKRHLSLGFSKQLANNVNRTWDAYYKDVKSIQTDEDKVKFAEEYDVVMAKIEKIVADMLSGNREFKVCDMCGRHLPEEEMCKGYKHRCKECEAKRRRDVRKAQRGDEVAGIVAGLDRKKMQAKQIYPNTIIVPYDRAVKVINQIISYYESKNERRTVGQNNLH